MNIAIVNNGLVENIVVVDNQEEASVILGQFFPDSLIVPVVEEVTGIAYIGFPYKNEKFVPFSPYESWSFNENTWSWEPPVPKPNDEDQELYFWNEQSLSWTIPVIDEEL